MEENTPPSPHMGGKENLIKLKAPHLGGWGVKKQRGLTNIDFPIAPHLGGWG